MSTSQLAQQSTRMESPSPRLARSHSVSSDKHSTASTYTGLLSPPLSVSPEPVFIAHSAASQIVTNDHDSSADAWLDQHSIGPSGETALVSPAALKLVNTFLDQLVFNFLSVSKSTSLVSLRPAVAEVLKSRLASDAVSGADAELREYLGGSEDDELLSSEREGQSSRDWDLKLVWKRTRLRCMVYSSLGDMEEKDEDRYTAQEHLNGSSEFGGRENESGIVSPAVAIFLTSILEFMGEQILIVGGQAAYSRLRMKYEKDERDGLIRQTDIAERVVVEEADMERVASDRKLGKLWRGWKKRIRSPTSPVSIGHLSTATVDRSSQPVPALAQVASIPLSDDKQPQEKSLNALIEYEKAAIIPLPMSVDDVREIEVPGLAPQSDDEDDAATSETEGLTLSRRPKSMVVFTIASHNLPTPNSSQPPTPIFAVSPLKSRKRANSLPPPNPSTVTSLFSRSSKEANSDQEDCVGPTSGAPVLNGTITPAESEKDTGEEIEEFSNKTKSAVMDSKHTPTDGPMNLDDTSKDVDSDYEFVEEEPQIMTSSRISFSGRISPDDKDFSSRSSLRSPSIHSLRLIDVNTAKSPTTRSRKSSFDATDFIAGRVIPVSRPNSINSPIISELSSRGTSPHLRSSNSSPLGRTGSNMSSLPLNTTTDSISEVDEREVAGEESPLTAVPSELAAAMQGVDVNPSPTTQDYPSFKPAASRPAPFVLAAPPTPQNYRESIKGSTRQQSSQSRSSSGFSNSKFPESEQNGQMTYQGAKKSFEPPSRSVSRPMANSASENSTILPILKEGNSPGTFKHIPRSSSVRRTSPTSSIGEEVSRKTISETQKSHRPSYTSTSSSSSVHRVNQRRVSEESGVSAMSSVGDSKSFEELIRGGETIQYTLTPQNMRAIESPDSPLSLNAIPVPRPATSRTHSTSVSKHTGLHSHPPSDVSKNNTSLKGTSRPSTSSSRVRANVQPRDARIERDSLGDFSDFIRTTGPAIPFKKEEIHSRSNSSAASENSRPIASSTFHKGTNGTPRNVSGSIPHVGPVATLPTRSASSAGRAGRPNKLQARDATVGKDSITDLIDFVRAGPDEVGGHRIPRTVAPFRSTMDSDQMSSFAGGKAIDASLPDSRYSQASTYTSTNHSVSSQTGLLNGASRANKPMPTQSSMNFDDDDDDDDMMPKRKTRRVRDPYAIDISDEEDDDEFEPSSRPTPIKEESLADFLRNVPPPPSPKMTSVFAEPPKPPKKKASFSSRFTRSGSTSQVQPPKTSHSANSRTAPTKYTPLAPTNPKFNAPPAVGSSQGNYNRQPEIPRATSGSNVVRKPYESREPVPVKFRSQTSDLADFLRSSEPPPSIEPKPFVHAKEESSFASRFFGRRKKSTAGF
ncbi:hypothetical protein EAF00_009701 [Botryotinia globosa]|nr:hypothetical protein EAF00_009701 [Botryotinia globosa]